MKLAETSVKRPVTVIMVMLIIILLGGVSLTRLPVDLFPKFELGIAIVRTDYTGVGPQEIEKLITNPIEGAIATVEGIDSVTSTTSEGSSLVIANFKSGTDMNFATLQMREKVDQVKRIFPAEVGTPLVMKFDPAMMPVLIVTLTSKEADLAELQSFAEDEIKPELERIAGVATVTVSGGYKNIVEIKVNPEKLTGYGISLNMIASTLVAENLNGTGGVVQKGNQELNVRTTGEFQTLEDIQNLYISLPGGGQVRLRDFADVSLGHSDLTTITRTNGTQSVSIAIQKQSGTNTVAVADDINLTLAKLQKEYPNLLFNNIMDQSTSIKRTINTVYREALLGGVLAVLIIFVFFHNVRTTFITATAIPIALMATFAVLYFMGITINMMTLGGITLAMGRLIDDNVVALENIFRYRQAGHSKFEAAIKGVSEVGMAITASTLVTVAVFLPIVFVQGVTASLFRALALTVTVSLLASLLVSLTLVPTLSSKLLNAEEIPEGRKGLLGLSDKFARHFDNWFSRIEETYKSFLNFALGNRKKIVAISIVVFLLSGATLFSLGAEFMPASDSGQLSVSITLPDGAKLEETDAAIMNIEKVIEKIPEVKTAYSIAGSSSFFGPRGSSTNVGSITVQLVDLKARKRSVNEVSDQVRDEVKDIPGMDIRVTVTNNMSMGAAAPLEVKIKGDDFATLKQIGDDVKKMVSTTAGTRDVVSSMNEGVPEVQIKIDRKKATQYGLTAAQISSAVKGMIAGTKATSYRYEGKQIDVMISGDDSFQQSIPNLQQTPIMTASGISIPVSQVAEVTTTRGPVSINRADQTRLVSITSQTLGRPLSEITEDIQKQLDAYVMPQGYSYELGGQNKEMVQSFKDLGLALVIAVLLVYMILASQFESLLHPFTIILSLPMGFSGSMLGLFITRSTLSVPAFIGLILLVGIVVSNAIVLVDYINKRREGGEGRNEAIKNAGPIRLRPIIMTTFSTILALLPMALGMGEGSETMAPMAVVVISGLLLSTVSTLLLVPVIYTIFEDIRERFRNRRKNKKNRKKPGDSVTA